jgi:GNAT superfamily N-acetyltransferase
MDIALDRARPGERWVLRCREPDGSATDVVGWLVAVDETAVRIAPGASDPRVVPRAVIIVARRAPAAQGGPDPRRVPAEDLERAAAPGWIGRHEPLGEWTLRAAGGFTARANSTLAVGDPGMPVPEAADRVKAYAARHVIEPWVQVITDSAEEAALLALGWSPVYLVTDVLVCRLTTLLGDGLPDPLVTVTEQLTEAWQRAYGRSRPNRLHQADLRVDEDGSDAAAVRLILDGQPPRAFAAVTDPTAGDPTDPVTDDELVAIARGHLSGPWLGIAAVWTEPEHRRRGLATAMMRALGHWAARRGARNVYLQVAQDNGGAHDAYGRLGFVPHHSYRYLAAPPV